MTLSKLEDYIKGNFLIAGVGNEQKEFDSVGIEVARKGKKMYPDRFIDCGVVPENYLGKIIDRKVETLIIVDTVYFEDVDDVKIFLPEELVLQGISSHSLSLKFIAEYLANWGIKTIIVGIKPTLKGNEVKERVISSLFELIAAKTKVL
jgi:hydrogenase maturation protease